MRLAQKRLRSAAHASVILPLVLSAEEEQRLSEQTSDEQMKSRTGAQKLEE